ncbi:MAG: hypothetical protein J3K34DRAFT_415283, partial [Monoraphidium minutum]
MRLAHASYCGGRLAEAGACRCRGTPTQPPMGAAPRVACGMGPAVLLAFQHIFASVGPADAGTTPVAAPNVTDTPCGRARWRPYPLGSTPESVGRPWRRPSFQGDGPRRTSRGGAGTPKPSRAPLMLNSPRACSGAAHAPPHTPWLRPSAAAAGASGGRAAV